MVELISIHNGIVQEMIAESAEAAAMPLFDRTWTADSKNYSSISR